MPEKFSEITFCGKRYVTNMYDEKIPKQLQEKIWTMLEEMKTMAERLHWVQVFLLKQKVSNEGNVQIIDIDPIKLDDLKGEKVAIELEINKLKTQSDIPQLTKEQVSEIFSKFKEFVLARDKMECKKIVQSFVREVVVYKDHVEVIFNVAFLIGRSDEGLSVRSAIEKEKLFKRWGRYSEFARTRNTAI